MCYSNRQIDNRIKKLQELEAQKKELEALISGLKEDIQADMGDDEIRQTDRFIIRYTTVKTSRFDSKAFKAEHAALYSQYTKETHSRRFTYKTA